MQANSVHHKRLLALGEHLAVPRCEGAAASLTQRPISFHEGTISVAQRSFAYGSPDIQGSRILVATGIYQCVAVLAYNSPPKMTVVFAPMPIALNIASTASSDL